MSRSMIDTIGGTIRGNYQLQGRNNRWLLKDNVRLFAPGTLSLGFSLDNKERPPFAFFKNDPPRHMAKMCDAIIVLSFEQRLYLFIVEQKTSDPDEYEKQLTNGRCFCDWLFSLYKEHGYCSDDPVYIGLLIWQPRPSPGKGKTSHGSEPVPGTHHRFEHFFEEKNKRDIDLKKFVQLCSGAREESGSG